MQPSPAGAELPPDDWLALESDELGAELELADEELGSELELEEDEDVEDDVDVEEAELPLELLHAAVITPTAMATAATLPTRDTRGDIGQVTPL